MGDFFSNVPGNLRDLLSNFDGLLKSLKNKQKIENGLVRVSEPASLFFK